MDIIREYVSKRFALLPNEDRFQRLKLNIIKNMEIRYNELLLEGKCENEATYVVISELGNFEDKIKELNFKVDEEETSLNNYTESKMNNRINENNNSTYEKVNYKNLKREEVLVYISERKKFGKLISLGVALCILGPAFLIIASQFIENNSLIIKYSEDFIDAVTLIPVLIILIPAIALFIYVGMKMENYNYIDKGKFLLDIDDEHYIRSKYEKFQSKFIWGIIIGTCLCIAAPIAIFLGSIFGDDASLYSVAILLFIVAIAVSIFINVSFYNKSLTELLKLKKCYKDKKLDTIMSIYWGIVVCIYLCISFIGGYWGKTWIVFPIAGVVHAIVKNIYSLLKAS